MKALVTGATGLVGKHLAMALHDANISVIAMGRNQDQLDFLQKYGVQPLNFDLTTPYEKYNRLDEYGNEDYIWFHCAAAITGATDDLLNKVNIQGTEKLVNKASELNIQRFILVSSIATYGVGHNRAINEKDHQSPNTNYGKSKLEQERIVKHSDLNYTIFRPPYITGPYDQNFMFEFAKRIKNENMPTLSKPGTIGIIDARDLATAMIQAMDKKIAINNDYNIQGTAIAVEDFINKLGKYLNKKPPYGPKYPYWFAIIIGFFMEIIAKLRGKNPNRGLSTYRIRSMTSEHSLNINKISEELGYESKYTLDESISDWLEYNELQLE